ncbi:hypothetical protein N0V93_008079 [Gnomoniopsis smithogilvyi]|uniref:AAA+ ATPase domain-containing protein n=1 Tax=Gnomoniopsis smithogilvyi TaxID=1191159 RepID=A0A9W8YLB4_9PEZI|nr:hypothetical protein N0V93_008079 [Gnomoniopsis smithogilvyi]
MAEQAEVAQVGMQNNGARGQSSNFNENGSALHVQNWEEFIAPTDEFHQFPIDILYPNGGTLASQDQLPERIRINAQPLLRILRKICGPRFPEEKSVTMCRPYRALLHHDRSIREYHTDLKDKMKTSLSTDQVIVETSQPPSSGKDYSEQQTELDQLRSLISLMDDISARASFLQSYECNTIRFSDLYLLYQPGDVVVSQDHRQAYRIIKIESEKKVLHRNKSLNIGDGAFKIHCVHIDSDGERLGPILRKIVLQPWGLTKAFSSLEILPLRRAKLQKEDLASYLIQRGATFVKVARTSPMNYAGLTLDSDNNVNGTVIIDFKEAIRASELYDKQQKEEFRKKWRPSLEVSLEDAGLYVPDFDEREECVEPCSAMGKYIYDDSYVDELTYQKLVREQVSLSKSEPQRPSTIMCAQLLSEIGTLTEEELIIMSYRIFGFIPEMLRWAELDVSYASPLEDVPSLGFDGLVVPAHVKVILRNLCSHHVRNYNTLEAANDRTGRVDSQGLDSDAGLVILLHGTSSAGKKTTVGCFARMFGAPLLRLPTELVLPYVNNDWEDELENFFVQAKRCKGIIMVDQADTILQGQVDYGTGATWDTGHQTLFRRAIMKMLDNFNGITFLIGDSNPFRSFSIIESSAREILSRINASFEYLPLDKNGFVKIFELNMRWISDVFSRQHQTSSRPACLVVEEDILLFASAYFKQHSIVNRWNCRQIRKAFSTALALAQADAEPLIQGQQEPDSLEPWKVTLKATHFEAVARSTYNFKFPAHPPPPQQSMRQHLGDQPGQMPGRPPVPRQAPLPPRPIQQVLPQSQRQHSQNTSRLPRRQMFPSEYSLQYNRELEYAKVNAPMPTRAVDDGTRIRILDPVRQVFFLTSPLSLEARPELNFMEWETFKLSTPQKGSGCLAIDVLRGEPVVSFDQEAQDSAWWSRWGDRNRPSLNKSKEEVKSSIVHKENLVSVDPCSSPLPERIRINSKYIAAVLEEIRGSRISKTSFVMVRPYRALSYFEAKIRAKHKELVARFEGSHNNSGSEEQADESRTAQADTFGDKLQPEKVHVANDHASSKLKARTHSGISIWSNSSSYFSSSSHNDEDIDTSSSTSLGHLKCLVEFLDLIKARVKYLSSWECTKVTFADLWFLYSPGQEVIDQGRRQVWRILSVNSSGHRTLPPWKAWEEDDLPNADMQEPSVTLDCVHIIFDGKMLGSRRSTFSIVSFEGEKEIATLPLVPLLMVKDPDPEACNPEEGFRQKLIKRGRLFVDIIRSKPMHYNGPLIHPKEEVDSQVVVDFEQCFAYWSRDSDFKRPMVEQLIGKPIGQSVPFPPCVASCCAGEAVHDDAYAEQKRNEAYIGSLIPDPQDRTKKPSIAISPQAVPERGFEDHELSDEDLVIMSYAVHGFVLRTRTWATLDLNYFSPLNSGASIRSTNDAIVDTNRSEENALDQLVLPKGHKDVVKSLISQHFQDKASRRYAVEEKDLIRGKGKGLIILLHGSPGVGKTTTAEGVAQAFNRPLFQITCGDLGTNARELEDALEWHFFLANKWNCILLLDEADVFLSVRSPEDFQRNSLVAVFLRVLEYYAGVLFLTTNRIGDFDEAFSSRIHISLYYPPLTRRSTMKIFDLNLRLIQQRIEERGVEINIEHQAILTWAADYWKTHKKMRWNGRQIRNACQTALALAEYDAQNFPQGAATDITGQGKSDIDKATRPVQLTISHLETVAKAYMQFMRYLHEIYGKDSERRAKAMGIRAREFSMKNWMKAWAESEQTQPREEDEDEEDSEEDPLGPKVALQNDDQQQVAEHAGDKDVRPSPSTGPPTVVNPGFPHQQSMAAAMGHLPLPTFPMPNMQGMQSEGMPFSHPFGVAPPFGQVQQPQNASYQQAMEYQRQYLASLATYGMIPGQQPASFPGIGAQAQPPTGSQSQGGTQSPATAHLFPGSGLPGSG